ncbi:RNA-guided endonuclease InsQ/TnpB family protein [Serratia sp. 2723]|uniref:RNA-guided endonuclease InsQ/TnpB family protein n=1 Tax=unclassified Serratia (in: enterobacteria) TaxID=2647522 RepID=UPI003D19D405
MKRAYKYRFYPTQDQIEFLAQTFGCVRFVYNSVLRWRTDAYRERQEKIGYIQANARLTALKKEPEFTWLNDVSCVPLQQTLRHQQAAFSNFFAGRAKYPTFKSKHHKQSAEFTASAFKYRNGKLYMAKNTTPLSVRWSRELPSTPSTVTISKDASGRYFVSCLCEFESKSLPVTAKMTGIDMGLKDLFVTDSGFKTGNPRHTAKYAKRLALLQRRLSKKKKGSRNRAKARLKVAKLHAKIADCRMDSLHKLSRKLINENQVDSLFKVISPGCATVWSKICGDQTRYVGALHAATVWIINGEPVSTVSPHPNPLPKKERGPVRRYSQV